MEFYVIETRKLAKDDKPASESILELRMSENTSVVSYDIPVTSVNSIAEAREMIKPENLLNTLSNNLSEAEWNAIIPPIYEDSYSFYDETYTFKGLLQCEHCGRYKKDVKVYDMRDRTTDAILQAINLCEKCANDYNKANNEVTVSLSIQCS